MVTWWGFIEGLIWINPVWVCFDGVLPASQKFFHFYNRSPPYLICTRSFSIHQPNEKKIIDLIYIYFLSGSIYYYSPLFVAQRTKSPQTLKAWIHIPKETHWQKTMVAMWYSLLCVNRVSASSPPTTTKYKNKIWRPGLKLKRII
jgi:hypothetical protein